MEIWNKLFSEGKNKNENNTKKNDYLLEAQAAVNIVETSVESGSFSEMAEKLENLPSMGRERKKYVFKSNTLLTSGIIVFICTIFSIAFLWYIPIFAGTIYYSREFRKMGCIGMLILLLCVAFNICIIAKMILNIKFSKRYTIYMKNLRFKNMEIVEDLANYAKVGNLQVIKDLKRAVKINLIPQGHFGSDDLIFIVSDETYEKYKEKQALYDRYYRKQVEERMRMKERTKEMQDILDQGQQYVKKIHRSNDIIKNKTISKKLDRMESVVSMIFHEVDINPRYANKLGMFMSYYLPTTEKLLEAYIEINEKEVKDTSLEKSKNDIEVAIDKIIDSFERILDKFYQEQEEDISMDISTMEILMKQEGLTD